MPDCTPGLTLDIGHSYDARNKRDADGYLQDEFACGLDTVKVARELGVSARLVLSIGASPTARASAASTDQPVLPPDVEIEM